MRSPAVYAVLLVMLICCTATVCHAEQEILIGLIPEENIFNQMARHKPLASYLSDRLKTKVRFTILSRYGDVMDRFMTRKMDGAFFGVFTGVLAMEKLDAEPIAHPVNSDGTSDVQSYIFVRKDSNIRNAADMQGKRIAFVDRATVTGYLFALSYLKENGITDPKKYFREISFTGSHGSAIYAVLDGRADIGTAKSKIFQMLVAKDHIIKDELVIIKRSKNLPDTTLFLRKDMPKNIRDRIREILLSMHNDKDGREVLHKLDAKMFSEAKKGDFSYFQELAQKAGITPRTYNYR